MEFSALMYDVSVEVKNFEKLLKNDDQDLSEQIIKAISNVERACYKLELKSKGIELTKKKFNKDINKEKNEVIFYKDKNVEMKETIKNLLKIIQTIKGIEKEIASENETYFKEIHEKSQEIIKGIEEKVQFKDSDLEEMQKENERMKNDFDNLMNLYNQKKDEHIQRCKNL